MYRTEAGYCLLRCHDAPAFVTLLQFKTHFDKAFVNDALFASLFSFKRYKVVAKTHL